MFWAVDTKFWREKVGPSEREGAWAPPDETASGLPTLVACECVPPYEEVPMDGNMENWLKRVGVVGDSIGMGSVLVPRP